MAVVIVVASCGRHANNPLIGNWSGYVDTNLWIVIFKEDTFSRQGLPFEPITYDIRDDRVHITTADGHSTAIQIIDKDLVLFVNDSGDKTWQMRRMSDDALAALFASLRNMRGQ